MPSWRDTASPQAQRDLDELLNTALGFAQQQLASRGEFYPYAVAIRVDGRAEMIPGRPAQPTSPATTDVIASCLSALAARQTQIRAGAVVADVHAPDLGQDAIEVSLEHAEGQALRILLPYAKQRAGIDYGPIRASVGSRSVWAQS